MNALTESAAIEMFRRPPDRYLDVGQGAAAYRRIGAGPDVLFVHGWPVSGATWRKLLPYLADHVTCHVIDFPGTGSSRFDPSDDVLTIRQHIETVRRVIDQLDVEDIAVVGHDSGGMIARHAVVGDQRLRAMGLIDTEQSNGLSWRFKQFLMARRLPGFGSALRRVMKSRRLRRQELVLGGAFHDRSLLDGEFDEFFLRPIVDDDDRYTAAIRLLESFDSVLVDELGSVHPRLSVPVQLVWGADDPFFPVDWALEMVTTFPNASLAVVDDARLFSHEERPAEVAEALLPVLVGDSR